MENSYFLEFNEYDKKAITEVENERKEGKLESFFLELLKKNELDYFVAVLNKKEPFYENIDTKKVFNKTMEDLSNSLFKFEEAIKNTLEIHDKKYEFIKKSFLKQVRNNIKEIEKNNMTQDMLKGSPFHQKTLELGLILLQENPQYINEFKDIKLKEFEILIRAIELNQKLDLKFPEKNRTEKKHKI